MNVGEKNKLVHISQGTVNGTVYSYHIEEKTMRVDG